jgi:cell division protein FtsI/penicillin-binding protein 2
MIIAVVVVALVAAAVPAGLLLLKNRREAAQKDAAQAFATAWQGGTLAGLAYAPSGADSSGPAVAAAVQKVTGGLTSAAKDNPSDVTLESVETGDAVATARLKVTWSLAGNRSWSYATSVKLLRRGSDWRPEYQPTVVHPDLTAGEMLRARTRAPRRGEIIGAGDQVLVTERPVVVVGIQRSRADNVDDTADQVAAITGVDGAALAKRVKATGADAFAQVIVLRRDAYDKIKARLQPIPGTVFQERTLALAPTADFARALLGTVGPATAEIVKASKGRVGAGDETGLSGLQRAYDEQLAGSPGLEVRAVKAGSSTTAALFTAEAVNGKAVRITLDEKTQLAAEAALGKAKKPAALVAIQPGTGAVLAIANGGPNAAGYNRALLGRYPPGSTFKVASGLGLLEQGVTPNTKIVCPARITVGGRSFKNAEDEVLGSVPFHTDFANSCNTAFVGSSTRITARELAAAARSLGYGQANRLGVEAFTGSVPTSGDSVAHAAAMIGQGTVLTSPVTVAGASAAVKAGRWAPPRLVLGDGEKLTASPEGSAALPATSVRPLRALMREVVTGGTGVGLRNTPGGDVFGKTGTAEFGTGNPPKTHAWFTGFQGDLAFAVVVEDGGFGAATAVPIVRDFLTRLAR